MSEQMELLPCPFCGGKAVMDIDETNDEFVWHAVGCGECNCLMDQACDDAETAARVWNTRLSHSPRPGGTEAETIERCAKVADAEVVYWNRQVEYWRGSDDEATNRCACRSREAERIAQFLRALTPQTTGADPEGAAIDLWAATEAKAMERESAPQTTEEKDKL